MSILPIEITPKSLFYKIIIALTTVFLIALMFPKRESIESDVTEGTIWLHDDLIAQFSFPIIKAKDVYQRELHAAEKSVYPVFIDNVRIEKQSIDSLNSYNSYLVGVFDNNIVKDSIDTTNPTFLSSKSFAKFQSIRLKERNHFLAISNQKNVE